MSTAGEIVDQLRDIAKKEQYFLYESWRELEKIINSKLIDGPQAADCDDERW